MKAALTTVLSLLMIVALACGGCFFMVGNAIKKGGEIHAEKLAAMTPDQRAFYELENELQNDSIRIRREFQQFVTDQLKSPKTAEFELATKAAGHDGKKVVLVSGSVSSQNSFGALLTKKVFAEYLDTGNGYNLTLWHLDDQTHRYSDDNGLSSEIIDGYKSDRLRLRVP